MVTRVTPLEFYTIIVVSRNPIHYLIPNMAIYHSPCILCSHYFYGLLHPTFHVLAPMFFLLPRTLSQHLTTPLHVRRMSNVQMSNLQSSNPQPRILNSEFSISSAGSAYPYILDAKHATVTIMSSCPMGRTASLPVPL